MTPASALSRLEKLAAEKCPCTTGINNEFCSCGNCFSRAIMLNGGKALLQILSEPGEACGPHLMIQSSPLSADKEEYVPLTELLQARAGIARYDETISLLDKSLDEKCVEIQLGKAALASSEARVRVLTEALEKISSSTCKKKTQTHTLNIDRANDALFELGATARQALLEVQR